MLELAGGRGGDMWRHSKYRAREIFLVDIDDKALGVCVQLGWLEMPIVPFLCLNISAVIFSAAFTLDTQEAIQRMAGRQKRQSRQAFPRLNVKVGLFYHLKQVHARLRICLAKPPQSLC